MLWSAHAVTLGTLACRRRVGTVDIGPIEYAVFGFEGNNFTGAIAQELQKLVEGGTIRVLDLVFLSKDADGNVTSFEYDDEEWLAPFASIDGEVGGLLSLDDVEYAADALEPNASAALLVWEDLWATPLVEAIRKANGTVLEGARIPHDLVVEAFGHLETAH
jgi:hypothetical protein